MTSGFPSLLFRSRFQWRLRPYSVTGDEKRRGRETAIGIERIVATVLNEARERQVEEVVETLEEGPEGLYE